MPLSSALDGMPFKVITDHASLKWLIGQKDLASRRAATRFSLESTACHNCRAWGLQKSLAKLYMSNK